MAMAAAHVEPMAHLTAGSSRGRGRAWGSTTPSRIYPKSPNVLSLSPTSQRFHHLPMVPPWKPSLWRTLKIQTTDAPPFLLDFYFRLIDESANPYTPVATAANPHIELFYCCKMSPLSLPKHIPGQSLVCFLSLYVGLF
jgi:hypothetical protein